MIEAAVESVRAALRDELEGPAAVAARRRVVKAGLQFDLLERFERRRDVPRKRTATLVNRSPRSVDPAVAAEQVGDVDAVEHEAVVCSARAVHARRDGGVVV